LDVTSHLPPQHGQLMPERGVLCLKSRLFDGDANSVRKNQRSAIIAVDVRRFGHVINKDRILATHRT
jgi:hypothetical protein